MNIQQKVEKIAEICHNVNKRYCESQGDKSQVEWSKAPENIKESSRDGVRFHLGQSEFNPAGSHENWMKFKLEDGWKLGKKKDVENKIHPLLVPYDKLPKDQQAKDYIFAAIVEELKDALA